MNMPERLLAPVPATTHAQAGVAVGRKWSSDYNVACWVRTRSSVTARLSLLLRFRDDTGIHEVVVDSAECGGTAGTLLAGRPAVQAAGPIGEMSVWLLGDLAAEVIVDELYVQRAGTVAAAPRVAQGAR